VVTPIASQREKCEGIAAVWRDEGKDYRLAALARIRPVASIDDAVAAVRDEHGIDPLVVATTAQPERFPGVARRSPAQLVGELHRAPTQPALLLFGTGWGLVDSMIPQASRVLAPISGRPAWNHLSVRSAVAILLDRMFGLRDEPASQP
jgi:tRNA (guanine37-N1)-methyltransferase